VNVELSECEYTQVGAQSSPARRYSHSLHLGLHQSAGRYSRNAVERVLNFCAETLSRQSCLAASVGEYLLGSWGEVDHVRRQPQVFLQCLDREGGRVEGHNSGEGRDTVRCHLPRREAH
jgi:hypothetical protein